MVKRITAAVFALLLLSVSILGQIDYNKQIKNGPAISQGNINNIRVVDGLKFAKSAAGINAADADLGDPFNTGEIWVPSTLVTATDAQISISAGHKLRIFGTLLIDAVNKGPILLGTAASITCVPAPNNAANIQQSGAGTVPSMIRETVQDGSQTVGMVVEGCNIYAGVNPVTNGVIDATGSTSRGWIRDNIIQGYTSGWGIFIQDNQTGALAGTNGLQILNNQIFASSTAPATGGCIEITHSATVAVNLNGFEIQDTTCIAGGSITTAPVLLSNSVTSTGLLAKVNITNMIISGTPGTQPDVNINGVGNLSIRLLNCASGSVCLNIASATQNLGISADNVFCFSCTNTLSDVANSVNLSNISVGHYDLPVPAIPTYSGTYHTIYNATIANLNGIRIVDGVKFAQSAAGINAADADLGTGIGEIWVMPSVLGGITATDAQISISKNHTLRVMGGMNIDAATKGPILLATGARLVCGGPTDHNQIANVGTNPASMVRLAVQDGSVQDGIAVIGCDFYAGNTTVTNGVIDATGSQYSSVIRDNFIFGYNSGYGIFIQDNQTGALAGTFGLEIQNNNFFANNTGACLGITHSATNNVAISNIKILDNYCVVGTTSASSLLLQNLDATASHLRQIYIENFFVSGTPSGQSTYNFNGVQNGTFKGLSCLNGTTCVNIPSNNDNSALTFDNVFTYSASNTLVDFGNNVTICCGASMLHYDLNGVNPGPEYLNSVAYLKTVGNVPASATVTGAGTGATLTFDTGSINEIGYVFINSGTTPGSSGTITINFDTTQITQFSPHLPPVCVEGLTDSNSSWTLGATARMSNWTTNSVVFTWSNNGTNIAASTASALRFGWICIPK